MSQLSQATLDYGEPRTIWVNALQLFYTIVAMIPVFYYLREIMQLPPEGRYVIQIVPIGIATLLYFLQTKINEYFYYQEKIYKDRDIFKSALKSFILVIGVFYFLFLWVFGYWLSGKQTYEDFSFSNPISKVMGELAITLSIILIIAVMMTNIQQERLSGRRIFDRFRRK